MGEGLLLGMLVGEGLLLGVLVGEGLLPYLPEYKSTWYISRPPIFRLKNRYFDDTLCISRVPQIPVVTRHRIVLRIFNIKLNN